MNGNATLLPSKGLNDHLSPPVCFRVCEEIAIAFIQLRELTMFYVIHNSNTGQRLTPCVNTRMVKLLQQSYCCSIKVVCIIVTMTQHALKYTLLYKWSRD